MTLLRRHVDEMPPARSSRFQPLAYEQTFLLCVGGARGGLTELYGVCTQAKPPHTSQNVSPSLGGARLAVQDFL